MRAAQATAWRASCDTCAACRLLVSSTAWPRVNGLICGCAGPPQLRRSNATCLPTTREQPSLPPSNQDAQTQSQHANQQTRLPATHPQPHRTCGTTCMTSARSACSLSLTLQPSLDHLTSQPLLDQEHAAHADGALEVATVHRNPVRARPPSAFLHYLTTSTPSTNRTLTVDDVARAYRCLYPPSECR